MAEALGAGSGLPAERAVPAVLGLIRQLSADVGIPRNLKELVSTGCNLSASQFEARSPTASWKVPAAVMWMLWVWVLHCLPMPVACPLCNAGREARGL